MQKQFFAGAVTALTMGFLGLLSQPAGALETPSYPSYWSTHKAAFEAQTGFSCSENPGFLDNGAATLEPYVYQTGATATSVTAVILPTMEGDCDIIAPIGHEAIESLEVYLAPSFQASTSQMTPVYLDPNKAVQWTFKKDSMGAALKPGHTYQIRVREVYKTSEGDEYENSRDSFDLNTAYPNKGYKVKMSKDGYISAKLKSTTNYDSAKFRAVFVTKKGKYVTSTVKYFSSAGKTTPWRHFRGLSSFNPGQKYYVITTVSKKTYGDALVNGEVMENFDWENFQKPRIYRMVVKENGEVKFKQLKKKKRSKPCGSSTTAKCKVK